MKRASRGNKWVEADWEQVKNISFNMQVLTANAIVIGVVENQAKTICDFFPQPRRRVMKCKTEFVHLASDKVYLS
jgi:hypothetical protein